MNLSELRARANAFKRFRRRGMEIKMPFSLAYGKASDFHAARDVAFTECSSDGITVYFHPQVDTRFSDAQALGVLYHELGHVFELTFGEDVATAFLRAAGLRASPSEERRADQLAEAVFGRRVGYDAALIQTVQANPAHLTRPAELG